MSREFVEAVAKNNNLGAAEIYKEVMIQKVGAALEKKRKEVAKEYVPPPADTPRK
jgi:hypothetical protein